MSFQRYDLLKASYAALRRMEIDTPTPIQEAAIPILLEGRDVIGQARTGSGKTLAFALPLMEFVHPQDPWIQALVLVPTRELAVQVAETIQALGRSDGIKTVQIFGGRSMSGQVAQLRGAHVVVGAPGRVLDLARQGSLKLDRVHYLVLDEADEMLDRGFAPDVERILAMLPRDRQSALFSATMPDWVRTASRKHLYQPEVIRVESAPCEVAQIRQLAYWVAPEERLRALTALLDQGHQGSTLVFGRTKHGVKRLAKQLTGLGYRVECLQGNMSQNARDRAMASFRAGQARIMVATNVAARGLDVDHIELVVNYELPETSEQLTHRSGRTGRVDREGTAVTLLTRAESDKWRALQQGLGRTIDARPWKSRSSSGSR